MNLPDIKIEELLEAGVHFGHNVRRWNPKMEEYIFGVRNNIHIFDLRITADAINSALLKLHETVSKSGKILFVGTKKQCAEIVKELEHKFYLSKAGLLFCDVDRGEISDEDMMVWINRYGSRK